MNTIVRDRLIYTLNDCGILAMSPKKQNELAEKLEADGFTPENVAKLWRISKRANRSDKDATASLATLLKDTKEEIQLVLKHGRDESAYPGEGQMLKQKEWEPEKDGIRAARMAYALVVCDRKTHAQAAWEIGIPEADIEFMIERGRDLVTPDLLASETKITTDPKEHARRIAEFRLLCKGNQLPIPQEMLDTIRKVNATPYK